MKRLLINGVILTLLAAIAGIGTTYSKNSGKANLIKYSDRDTIPVMKDSIPTDTILPADSLVKEKKHGNFKTDTIPLGQDTIQNQWDTSQYQKHSMQIDTVSHPLDNNMPTPPVTPVDTSMH